jgi:hypothetical protein
VTLRNGSDLANAAANNRSGQARTRLELLTVYRSVSRPGLQLWTTPDTPDLATDQMAVPATCPIGWLPRDRHGRSRTDQQARRLGLQRAALTAETTLIRKRSQVQVLVRPRRNTPAHTDLAVLLRARRAGARRRARCRRPNEHISKRTSHPSSVNLKAATPATPRARNTQPTAKEKEPTCRVSRRNWTSSLAMNARRETYHDPAACIASRINPRTLQNMGPRYPSRVALMRLGYLESLPSGTAPACPPRPIGSDWRSITVAREDALPIPTSSRPRHGAR